MTTNTEKFVLTHDAIASMALSDVEKYVKDAQVAFQRADRSSANATNRAAYATHAAFTRGLIANPAIKGRKPEWTQEEFATNFLGRPASKSLVTGWKTLGHALVEVGLSPESDTYIRLRNSNAYGKAPVKEAIYADGATEESVKEVLDKFVNPDGSRIAQKREANPDKGEVETGEGVLSGKALAEYVAERTKDLLSAVRGLDLDTYGLWETGVREALDAMNTERAEQAAGVQRESA
jgi:hypothetical protein